jgi:uncharacterized membrane protein YheB (UPF0754 family)
MLGKRKVKKMLSDKPTDLESKLNKIVNTEVIDTAFSHTLQKHLKQQETKTKITPNEVFEKKNKCKCKNASSNGRMEKK